MVQPEASSRGSDAAVRPAAASPEIEHTAERRSCECAPAMNGARST